MERTQGEGKKMSLIKKLAAGSALVLMTGCVTTPFEGNVNGAEVLLIHDTFIDQYTLKITGSPCNYILHSTSNGKVYDWKRSCKCSENNACTISAEDIKGPQETFDEYIHLIKEPIK